MDSFFPLRLKACDLEDLQVIASRLQDSLMPVMTMIYDTKRKPLLFLLIGFDGKERQRFMIKKNFIIVFMRVLVL